ncbi:MAG: DUF1573 domain-containing protein [Verrucomicrobiota bacterium]|nr:DUF1573 domain-containing protein [Verrucomicrobiota bacterium]
MKSKAGFFFSVIFPSFLLVAASAQAQLTWEKTEVDLHPKPGDADAVAQFHYTNKTGKPIKITNVRTSCGCTVATLKKNDVAPGESGEVTATLKIGGRSGLQQKLVTVETDDPAQPSIGLILKADLTQPIELRPPFVFWEQGETLVPRTISVKAAKEIKLTKLDVSSSIPEFTATVEKGTAPNEFTITVQPKDTSKPLDATLTIKSDYPQTFYATMRVMPPGSTR